MTDRQADPKASYTGTSFHPAKKTTLNHILYYQVANNSFFHFSSDCCVNNKTLIPPDQVVTTKEGMTAKCCHGELMVKQEDDMVEINLQQSSMKNNADLRSMSGF